MAIKKSVLKFEDDFRQKIELNNSKLDISGIQEGEIIDKENYTGDLSKLISCSENYYEDLIKIYSNCFKVIKIDHNTILNLSGIGILYIVVEKNLRLELNFKSPNFSAIFIKILVKEGVNLDLIEKSNSKDLYKNLFLFQEKRSNLIFSQFIYDCKLNFSLNKIEDYSTYDLKSGYHIKNNDSYINNIVLHIKENSKSKMIIRGGAEKNSNVICNGKIKILRNSKNCVGIQNLKNIIIDETSNIESEPILEIENNEVICSHSSSISKISKELLFYLNSKGISNDLGIDLIIKSFFNL